MRAPLAHVANRVFLDLVTEIERQGVPRKVVADMFGLALRSYQQKVQRLSESATESGRTLWEAVYEYIKDKEITRREEVLARFARDEDASVKSILNDLVESGLVYRTGRGADSVFRVTPEEDLGQVSAPTGKVAQAMLWFRIYREGPISHNDAIRGLRGTEGDLDDAIDVLVNDGRIERREGPSGPTYQCRQCVVPLGDAEGWEAALVDHLQMVTSSICAKLRNGKTRALPSEEIGGSSYSFDVWPGHPAEQRVRALLSQTRANIGELWNEVAAYNRQHDRENFAREDATRVSFYFGQSLKPLSEPEEECP